MKNFAFKLLAGPIGNIIGHSNLLRTGAFLMRAGRLDLPNSIDGNGEALVQKTVLKYLEESKMVVIDCGANKGQWSTELFSSVKETGRERPVKVFCFEPSSYTFVKLTDTLKSLQSEVISFEAVQKALSSQPGSIKLKIVHDGAGTNSLIAVPGAYSSEELVTVTTIDEFSEENALARIDLLKVDAEGHDFEVILGAREMLTKKAIDLIQFEYNWRWIYGKHFLQEAFQFLGDLGYIMGKITPAGIQFYPHYDIQLESFVEGNYLACTEAWKDRFAQVSSWFE